MTKIKRIAAKRAGTELQTQGLKQSIDVGCVIHGSAYDWIYVERLYNMVHRHLDRDIRFHVWTETDRSVPSHMIKHCLEEWPGITGPRKSWWYKMQMFNPEHHDGDLLYFDLDVVIVSDISWITQLPTTEFWALHDFRYLQRPSMRTMNSSVMWWNVGRRADIWQEFARHDILDIARRHQGDQDYLFRQIQPGHLRYFPDDKMVSWRWQALDGGYDFQRRQHRCPGRGTEIPPACSVLVLHGRPKPHEITDAVIHQHWC
jgi:hypothetical protein